MQNQPKINTFKFDRLEGKMHTPNFSQLNGFTKLYKMNISKMLLKGNQQIVLGKQKSQSNDNPQEINIVSAGSQLRISENLNIRRHKNFQRDHHYFYNTNFRIDKIGENKQSKKHSEKRNQKVLRIEQDSFKSQICHKQEQISIKNEIKNQEQQEDKGEQRKKEERKSAEMKNKINSSLEEVYIMKKNSLNPKLPKIKSIADPNRRQKSDGNTNNCKLIKKSHIPMLNRDTDELKGIKAEAYAILQYPSNNLLLSFRANNTYEIASLTKIMTFYCVRNIQRSYKLKIEEEKSVISDHAMIGGTSAELFTDQVYTVKQLLYGLMLPSGNDAALALAIWGGKIICERQAYPLQKQQQKINKYFTNIFIKQMNNISKQLNLNQTRFGNPHGLPHPDSRSTAFDMCKLTSECMKDEVFCEIIGTKEYKCMIGNTINEMKREVEWINTNKLLRRDNFVGVKTGITVTAGPCLASAYKFRDQIYITIILRANKVSRRFKQTRKLLAWTLTKLYKNNLTKQEEKIIRELKRNQIDFDSDYSEDERQFNYDRADDQEMKKRCSIITHQM